MPNFARYIILLQILFWAGLCGSAGLAIAGPEVFIQHTPIQTDNNREVTYKATASDPQGIKSIVISVELRELKLHQGQKISDFQTEIVLETCTFTAPFKTSEDCETKHGPYDNGDHIGYKVTATNGVGETSTEGYIYFAAGTFPWPDDPIPIYVRGNPAAKVDLVFIPDKDYITLPNWKQAFMQNVTDLIWTAFFSEESFARGVRSRSEMWNFYITYQLGEFVPPCFHDKPPNWPTLRATVNAGFIVHNDPFQDCSGIGEGSVFSAEPIDPNNQSSYTVPIHELGHSVFSLADEYSGGYLFHLPLHSHNVFPTKQMCKSNARSFGWPEKDCKKIGQTGWFRSDGRKDIMKDTAEAENAPGRSGGKRYDWHYDQCTGQNC